MKIELADRLKKLPPYLFVEIDRAKKAAIEKGQDIIDLGIGDPDTPTPDFIIDSLKTAVMDPRTHKYALDQGAPELRREIAAWFKVRFNVTLDPDKEILPLIGSKEGIAHFPMAFINPGDVTLVPDPCYPPYKSGTLFAGGTPHLMPLKIENGFLPVLEDVDPDTLKRTKMMFLNYPNNPTSAVCDREYYKKAVNFASKNKIIICNDAAYSEMAYDGYKAMSILEIDGARDVSIEFHSLSKTFNMTGWRIGFAVGNAELIAGLAKVKSNIDSGIFTAIQMAGVTALRHYNKKLPEMIKMYEDRRNVLVDGLNRIGWKVDKPKATFYVWAPVAKGYDSISMAKLLLEKASLVATPGNGFGPNGEGYIRFALTVKADRMNEAVERIKKVL